MLGPVRFTHIEVCAREVCRAFKITEEIETCIEELKRLDEELARLRAELASIAAADDDSEEGVQSQAQTSDTPAVVRLPDYNVMLLSPPDLPRAKRLITARQNALKSVRSFLGPSHTSR